MATQQAKPWLESRLPFSAAWRAHVTEYRAAREQPYLATLTGLILGTLIFLALSGAVLSLFYVTAEGSAYDSIQFITRSVNFGWLIQSFHSTGTTMVFGALYLSLFRSLLISSYKTPGELVWFLELALFILLLLAGYLGYVLADGATSYWSLHNAALAGARLNSFPGVIADWIFGGPAGPGTLARMMVFHVFLAVLLLGVVVAQIAAKRAIRPALRNSVPAHPYYTSQYFVAFVVFALIFAVLVFFAPHLGENPLNAEAANPLVVPDFVTPPWYLLPVAAIGGALPGTLGGIVAVIAGLAVLAALPWLDRSKPGASTGLLYKLLVFILALDVIGLSITAAAPASALNSVLMLVFTAWYFLHFLVLTPLTTAMEAK
jgi:ubiquinol-cytochrome c reductase cytochrome b subunit